MAYAFRLRIHLTDPILAADTDELVLATTNLHGEDVWLRSYREGEHLSSATRLICTGQAFDEEADAREGAMRWTDWLRWAFAALHVAADLGDRAVPAGRLSDDFAAQLLDEIGITILPDIHGATTYPLGHHVRFSHLSARGHRPLSSESLLAEVHGAREARRVLSSSQRVAYSMYAISSFQPNSEAQFLVLMMALEALIPKVHRSELSQQHVARLIVETKHAVMTESDRSSILGSLRDLRYRSIGQTGRQLVGALEPSRFMGLTPVAFFNACYALRSQLVHGNDPLPSREDISLHAAHLELMVGDLIADHNAGPPDL